MNESWRGAFDLIIIGGVVMFLSQGFSSNAQQENVNSASATSQIEKGENTKQAESKSAAANFGVVSDDDKNTQSIPPSVNVSNYTNLKGIGGIVWINNPEEDDLELLNQAVSMIGNQNESALMLINDKARSGDANFQFLMGVLHVNLAFQNRFDLQHAENAVSWYKASALQGHPDAQYQLGQIFRLGRVGIHKNLKEAIKWYRMAADNTENQSGDAENELGRMHDRGEGLKKDELKAIEFYTRSAEKGNVLAQSNLGAAYYNGISGKRNLEQAIYWVTKAAKGGDRQAQMNLALMYYRGRITGDPDYVEYLKWAGVAAEQGYVEAMISLGDFHRREKPNFDVNHVLAVHFYKQAAIKKNSKAQFALAEMYEHGLGVPQDNIQALVYYNLSYNNGYMPALASAKDLRQKMSDVQLTHADKMIKAIIH